MHATEIDGEPCPELLHDLRHRHGETAARLPLRRFLVDAHGHSSVAALTPERRLDTPFLVALSWAIVDCHVAYICARCRPYD